MVVPLPPPPSVFTYRVFVLGLIGTVRWAIEPPPVHPVVQLKEPDPSPTATPTLVELLPSPGEATKLVNSVVNPPPKEKVLSSPFAPAAA